MIRRYALTAVLTLFLIISPIYGQIEQSSILTAQKIDETITIDGNASEGAWSQASVIFIPVVDGSIGNVDVEMKALYDNDYVYMFISWPDPTKSDTSLWRYNGSAWIPPQETTQDIFSVFWNIDDSVEGFNIAGCSITCHADRMKTNTPDERAEYWKWGAADNNPLGYMWDGYLDNSLVLNDTTEADFTQVKFLKTWHAHKIDSNIGSFNEKVVNAIFDELGKEILPRYYKPNPGTDPFHLSAEDVDNGDAVRLWEGTYPQGFIVPAYILYSPSGSAADIESKGIYQNRRWNLELKRKISTGNDDDIQFDTSRTYRFSIAIHDNSHGAANEGYGKGHSISMLARTLEFGGLGSEELGQLVLIRDYMVAARAYLDRGEQGLAFSEFNNGQILFNQIRDEVAARDPNLYVAIRRDFSEFKRLPTREKIDEIIDHTDSIILTFQGKRAPAGITWDLELIILWSKIQLYVFIGLALLALHPVYRAIKIGRNPVFRRMSIFLLLVIIPIFLEGVGRVGIITGIDILQNFSFMTNEYATLLWAVVMLVGLFAARAGFTEVDKSITSLERYGTELENRVDEIQRLKGYIENVVNNSPIGITVVDRNGLVTFINPAYLSMMGHETEDKIKGGKFEFAALNEVMDEVLTLTRGESINKEELEVRRDITLSVSGAPLYDAHDKLEGAVLLVENITDRRKLERQLFQSEKLASIGQMAAGVAHEINNPLTSISLNAQILVNKEDDSKKKEKLEIIESQVDTAANIIRNLLDFSRQVEPEITEVDVNDILKKSLVLASFQIKNVNIVQEFEEIPFTMADRNQLQQVFMNIILNGAQAMPGGGILTIKTTSDGENVKVTISDTGLGIKKEHLSKIFDPFFTTKKVGQGTGLGLSICHGIIEAHGGTIEVDSFIERGTTFTISLPVKGE